jgi:hypothetical protein
MNVRDRVRGRAIGVLVVLLGLIAPAYAMQADGVVGLPTDVTSLLSIAGIWQPVNQQYITAQNPGGLAQLFHGNFTADPSGREHVIVAGWVYNAPAVGLHSGAVTPADFVILQQLPDGTMQVGTSNFVSSASTNGAGSLVVADFNGDGYSDIFLAPYNEAPFVAVASTALLSNGSGGFNKITLNDSVLLHDAELAMINGVPTVVGTGIPHPFYQYKNNQFVKTDHFFDASGQSLTNGQSMVVADFGGNGQYGALIGDASYGPGYPYLATDAPLTVLYSLDAGGNLGASPRQIITPYFNGRAQYANVSSFVGLGLTHVYRLLLDDFNHDGLPDVIGEESLFPSPPSALQMLQNQGNMKFQDVSDALTGNVGVQMQEFDYTTQIRDLDNSGINSYASGQFGPFSCSADTGCLSVGDQQSNQLLVNDGSGLLSVALHQQFENWGVQIAAYTSSQLISRYGNTYLISPSKNQGIPEFIAYKTPNGKINYLAVVQVGAQVNGVTTTRYVFVNVPLQLDLRAMYAAPMTVANRNGSHLIRTFAGDDTIYSGNDGGYAHVDGGLGTNTAVYAGKNLDYNFAKAADGTVTVADSIPGRDGIDTLANIQTLHFADQSIATASIAIGGTVNRALTVSAVGNGTVGSATAGVSCGTDGCSGSLPPGQSVTLTATPAAGSSFIGWGGSCSGSTCVVTTGTAAESAYAIFAPASNAVSLASAILPTSRSVVVGRTATVFATLINGGATQATACSIAPTGTLQAGFSYQTTNPATNASTGSPNSPVNLAPGAAQSFIISFTPTAVLAPTNVALGFSCANSPVAASTSGVNTLLLSASATATPDVVALAATASGDGILHITGATGSGAFAVASVNVGSGGAITATANTGSATLPLTIAICQTNPLTAACLTSTSINAQATINAGETPTFSIFATAKAQVPFSPGVNRIFVTFTDAGGAIRGSTSVAVQTQ